MNDVQTIFVQGLMIYLLIQLKYYKCFNFTNDNLYRSNFQ